MKRDMDLIRDILVFVEECEDPQGPRGGVKLPDYAPAAVGYHLRLLHAGGYLDARDVSTHGGTDEFLVFGLTMRGHDLADSLRDPDVWAETKSRLGSKFGTLALDVLAGTAKAIAKQYASDVTGLRL